MKKIIGALLMACTALSVSAAGEDVVREHRAIWMSSMLASTWPGGSITESNAESTRSSLDRRLEKLSQQGINTLYFHVRAHCDATYASSYEPYSAAVAGSRGGTPAYDPFGYFVECAHKHGIEVYAWVNPYRYSQGGNYGPGERNYENSHPEWLLRSSDQVILNPGLPEARQRVVDICSEIATNYDIDGMIFDDYFYHSSIGFSADKDLYDAYRASGGTLDQGSWRRDNVDKTVEAVRDAVKAARPYAVFAIGPAGRISPDNIGDYGLTPGPYGDMNYTGLYADPIKWLSKGWLDFLSPQVYWINYFDKLTEWYSVVVPHFGRHLYTSVDCSRLATGKAAEYLRQIDFMRSHLRPNESGVVFFDLGAYLNYGERIDGKRVTWGEILHDNTFPYTALAPLQPWRGVRTDYVAGPVIRNGDVITWTAASAAPESHRYAVYAIPAEMARTDFAYQPEYLKGVVYSEQFDISADPSLVYGVAVYDRYGRLHAFRFEGTGEMAAGTAPQALTPASGSPAPDLCDFAWNHEGNARYVVEVAEDEAFTSLIATVETTENKIASTNVAAFEPGRQYWWRVVAYAPDCLAAVSVPARFEASRITITSPAASSTDCSVNPVFAWVAAAGGTEYTLEIATGESFENIVHSVVTTETGYTVPERTLVSGKQYYARVRAARGGVTSVSDVLPFATADRTDYAAPVMLNPSADGVILNTDDAISVEPWSGLTSVSVEIAATPNFPVRNLYKGTLSDFATATNMLGDVRILSKPLTAGTTYYTRARGAYSLQGSSSLHYTEYSPVRSFVYSGEAGIGAPEVQGAPYVDGAGMLRLPYSAYVEVFDVAGRTVAASSGKCNVMELGMLPEGCYIIRIAGTNNVTLKWVK